jgi:hypothetical protein
MPNHVATRLEIKGSREEVKRFIDTAQVDGKFDFQGVLPMPEEIRNTTSPVTIMTQDEYDASVAEFNARPEEVKKRLGHARGVTQAMSDALIEKYGTDNWYNWARQHYGTKWGAYHAEEWTVSEDGTKATVRYDTAWSPATQAYLEISRTFALEFTHYFADEGGFFVGSESIVNGAVDAKTDFDWNGPQGKELRTELGYGDETELDGEEDRESESAA